MACRPPAIIFAVLLTLYALRAHRADFLRAFVPAPAILAALLLAYNLYYFGTLNGGYEGHSATHAFTPGQMIPAFYGLLLSPNRGLLIFSPVLLAGFAGLGVALTRRREPLLLEYVAVATLLTIVFYSSNPLWHGSFSYSYRFLVDLTPGLALGTAGVGMDRTRRWRAPCWRRCARSRSASVVGAFCYPCDWYRSTIRIPRTCGGSSTGVTSGGAVPEAGPVEPDGLRMLRGMLR